ncbi:MAG TPA: alcohol dehydrogenase catalytic domain-containing protein [Terracidiphilus sp.]|nr:alcohol dehydrogenase catalytic domain-containing protein [Terracidiphilus sp.]
MRALVYAAPRRVILEDCPRPHPAAGEVEIAVVAAGICGADISGFLGRSRRRTPPLILGHELVGRTRDGRRVVADPLVSCGRCADCLDGRENFCSGLRLLGMDRMAGCFAEFVSVPESQMYEIPDDLEDARAVFAEPLANIVHLFRLAAPSLPFRMGIVGAGTMGSLALKMALHMGVREVLVEDVDEVRLAGARRMGATLAVNSETGRGEVRSFAGRGLDLVLDASGEERARQAAFELCRPGGTVVLLGMAKERSELDFGVSIRKEHRALMSFGYTPVDFRRSLDLLVAGEIDLRPWTAEMPLDEGQRAFEKMIGSRGDALKMVLRVRSLNR